MKINILPLASSIRSIPHARTATSHDSVLKIVMTGESVVNGLLLSYVAMTPLIVIPVAGLLGASDLLFLPAVASVLVVGKIQRWRTPHLLLAAFLVLAAVSLYRTPDFTYLVKWGRLVGIAFPFYLACYSTITLKQVVRVFFWSGLLSILIGVALWWFDTTLFVEEANQRLWIDGGESHVRATGITGNSGAFGALIAMWTVACGMFAIGQERPSKAMLATIFLTSTVSLISSASRVAFVSIIAGFGAGGCLMLVAHVKRKGFRISGRALSPIILSTAVLLATLYFVIPYLMDQEWLRVIYSRFDPRAHSSSNSFLTGRVTIWRHYMQSMDQWGAFGVGYKQGQLNFSVSPHNQFLALASECGFLCLGVFVLFVANLVSSAMSRLRDQPECAVMCLAVITAFVADGMGGEPFGSWQVTPVTMILIGICVRCFAKRESAFGNHGFQNLHGF